MSYPGSVASYTSPAGTSLLTSPDHAGAHTSYDTEIVAIENTLGTTGGTALFNTFGAADKPLAHQSGTLQTAVTGTINNAVMGSPTVTGGTIANMQLIGTPQITGGTVASAVINNPTIGTPTVVIGSDATGDLLYRSSGGALTRVAIGANESYLTSNGTTPSWGTPATSGFQSGFYTDIGTGTVTLAANGTATALPMSNEAWDLGNEHAGGTFVCGTAGKYLVNAQMQVNTPEANSDIRLYVNVNGATKLVGITVIGVGGQYYTCAVNSMLNLTAGNTVTLQGYQDGTATKTVTANQYTFFGMQRLI